MMFYQLQCLIFKQRLPKLLKILDAVVYAFKNTHSELRSETLNSLFFIVFCEILCCFSTSISYAEAETKVMTAQTL